MEGDMLMVFKRLSEKAHKFMDESHHELELPEGHWGETPLFLHSSLKEE